MKITQRKADIFLGEDEIAAAESARRRSRRKPPSRRTELLEELIRPGCSCVNNKLTVGLAQAAGSA